ncbi:MAG: DapH/DapD/GlmU-related protein [Verrucomicrobiota bacterium JB023]|nr:DapH/DapD/GlmU-related protein [Verrucomicrobiota bacterium JB023]
MSFWPLEDPINTLPLAGHPLSHWLATGLIEQAGLTELKYPWQFLDLHGPLLEKLLHEQQEASAATPAQLAEGALLIAGEGTKILPGVYVEGLVIIGQNCKIGPNCYLRGPISIGDHCHVGQAVELKNTILGDGTNVGHLSYVGDSILANKVNFGAGTITSNLRHDGTNHRSAVNGEIIDTGRRKFGSIVGAGVHTGIHTSLYPGRKLGPGTTTLPGEVISEDRR